MRGGAERGRRLPAQRPVQAPADPHRADAALPVRPHHRARGRDERADRQGQRHPREGRLTDERATRRAAWSRRAVHGVLLLDKPLGLSSNEALQKAKRLLSRREGRPHRHARPAGHRPAAAVLRRRDQVRAGQPRRRQALPRDAAAGRDARRTGDAEGDGARASGRSRVDRARRSSAACAQLRRRDRASAADALAR